MWIEELILKNLEIIHKSDLWYRVVALDFETKIQSESDFLTNELILGVSLARRLSSNKIERKNIVLKEENLTSEFELLKELDQILLEWKPLIMLGYGCRDYDFILLALKKRKCKLNNIPVWGITNIINGSIHIELADLARYLLHKNYGEKRTYRKMIDIMRHKAFQDLPFINTKSEFDLSFNEKGKEIYETWKNKDPKFYNYLEAEAHDQLLIAERIRDLLIK